MKEALMLALDLAIMHHSDGGYAELRLKVRQLAKEALAQDEQSSSQEPVETLSEHYLLSELKSALTQPEPDYRAVKTYHEGKPVYVSQPEQEPVAFSCLRCVTPKKCAVHGCSPNTWPSESSSKRPWVGLTDEEIEDCMEMSIQKTCRAIEAKLKEKNT